MKKGKIVIKKTSGGEFYYNVIASNGKIISSSRMYDSEENLMGGVNLMRLIFSDDSLIIEEIPHLNENI